MKNLLLRCYIVLIALVLLFLVGCTNQGTHEHVIETTEQSVVIPYDPLPSRSISPIDEGMWTVVRVVDGDTLIVGDNADHQYRVRLIGADTPETVKPDTPVEAFGLAASKFTKQMVAEAGNRVRIAFDGEQLDRYNRTLAMVWLQLPNDQEVWLNELLIREGLARARLDYRYSHEAKLSFAVAEVEARKARKNLWKDGKQ